MAMACWAAVVEVLDGLQARLEGRAAAKGSEAVKQVAGATATAAWEMPMVVASRVLAVTMAAQVAVVLAAAFLAGMTEACVVAVRLVVKAMVKAV